MSPSTQKAISAVTDNGLPITLGGSVSATVFWGLHISDVAVIVSALAAVLGVVLQFYIALRRIRLLETEMGKAKAKAVTAGLVASAAAVASRGVAERVSDIESKLDA